MVNEAPTGYWVEYGAEMKPQGKSSRESITGKLNDQEYMSHEHLRQLRKTISEQQGVPVEEARAKQLDEVFLKLVLS